MPNQRLDENSRTEPKVVFNDLWYQAAFDGLGVAMGPPRLIADDVAAGRLMLPFAGPRLPARSYYAYVPEARRDDPVVRAFCEWLATAA